MNDSRSTVEFILNEIRTNVRDFFIIIFQTLGFFSYKYLDNNVIWYNKN